VRWTENSLGMGALAGCALGPEMTAHRQLMLEFCFSTFLLSVAYGVAFDARQSRVFGPILAPLCISATIGTCISASGSIAPESTGAMMNPARCFGPALVMGGSNWDHHWVFWIGPFAAAAVNAVVYYIAPPHHKSLYDEQRVEQDGLRDQRDRLALKLDGDVQKESERVI